MAHGPLVNSDIKLRKKLCGIPTEFRSLERVYVLAHANQSTCKWPLVKLSNNVGSKLNHPKLCIVVNIVSFVKDGIQEPYHLAPHSMVCKLISTVQIFNFW